MDVIENGSVSSPSGFKASGLSAGIKKGEKKDLALIYSEAPMTYAAAFTQNSFAAPPVVICKEIVEAGAPVHAVLINSGIANACTGRQGRTDALRTAEFIAEALEVKSEEVFVSSTGKIGVPLPVTNIENAVPKLVESLSDDGGRDAAEAIMTTDTVPKSFAVKLMVDDVEVTIGGTTKGAGMIAPNMLPSNHATMLAYVTTDADIEDGFLWQCLERSMAVSFNRITVDGDTSTNDSYFLLANGAAGNRTLREGSLEGERFQEALDLVCGELAKMMVRDAEGATRFVELRVTGAASREDAKACAHAIGNSLLCKTAWFGADPNWGRVLDAAGYSGAQINPERVSMDYGDTPIVRQGRGAGTPESEQTAAIDKDEFVITLDLGAGSESYILWTCDLSYEYVKINAEYKT